MKLNRNSPPSKPLGCRRHHSLSTILKAHKLPSALRVNYSFVKVDCLTIQKNIGFYKSYRVICLNLILGPVANIMSNGREITRSITCSMELSSNISEDTAKFSLSPIQKVVEDLMVGIVAV